MVRRVRGRLVVRVARAGGGGRPADPRRSHAQHGGGAGPAGGAGCGGGGGPRLAHAGPAAMARCTDRLGTAGCGGRRMGLVCRTVGRAAGRELWSFFGTGKTFLYFWWRVFCRVNSTMYFFFRLIVSSVYFWRMAITVIYLLSIMK